MTAVERQWKVTYKQWKDSGQPRKVQCRTEMQNVAMASTCETPTRAASGRLLGAPPPANQSRPVVNLLAPGDHNFHHLDGSAC